MAISAKYVHTNLMASDWRNLVKFYVDVFGCIPKPPERDYTGAWLDGLTGLRHAHLTGMHLILPGFEKDAPTLEIFHYDEMAERSIPRINEPGYGHLAFQVEDVEEALATLIAAGGSALGEIQTVTVPNGILNTVYTRDPEGNIIELIRWS